MTAEHNKQALKVLVCYYNSYGMPYTDDGIMLPIQAGKSISSIDLHIQGDNELNGRQCDNISDKNPTYSELTALYWAWKNLRKLYPEVEYVGWTHYRRFFAFDENYDDDVKIIKPSSEIKNYKIDAQKVIDILEAGKIIVPKVTVFEEGTAAAQYCKWHFRYDYLTLKEIMIDKFPDYYNDFIDIMEKDNRLHLFCMFIMKYDDFEKYCEWLFAVLAEVEPLVPYDEYSVSQKRVLAYMAERLFNVYLRKNKMNLQHLNIYFYEDPNGNQPNKKVQKHKNLQQFVQEFTAKLIHRK